MPGRPKKNALVLAIFVTLGCQFNGEGTDSTSGLGDDTGDDCQEGQPGCPCGPFGMCLDPLVCSSDSCVWPPPTPPTDPDSTGTGTGGDEDPPPREPAPCTDNEGCVSDQVCGPNGMCIPARESSYHVYVARWDPTTCDGGLLDGAADLFWTLSLGGEEAYRSPWVQGGCPGRWSEDESACIDKQRISDGFALRLYDQDLEVHDLMDQLWWDFDTDGEPDPLPVIYLHVGVFDADASGGGLVEVHFTPVPSCP